MGQSILSVRVDDDIKRNFDNFCNDAGMNTSVAVNMFIRAVLREKRIPFEIVGSHDPFYSVKNQLRLMEAMEQLEEGKGVERDLIEVGEVSDEEDIQNPPQNKQTD